MIDDVKIELDEKAYVQALEKLSGKELIKIEKKALNAGAAVIVAEAKRQLRNVTGKAKSKGLNARKGYNLIKKNGVVVGVKSLEQGIRAKFHGENTDEPFSKVNIMGDFRLKWFEKGTNQRSTRQGYNRGAMTATNFFATAQNASIGKANQKIEDVILSNLRVVWMSRS